MLSNYQNEIYLVDGMVYSKSIITRDIVNTWYNIPEKILIQPKIDGIRLLIVTNKKKETFFFTRNGVPTATN